MNNLYFCNKRIDKIVFILFLDCKCLFILNIQRGEKISKVIYIFSNNEEDEYFSHKAFQIACLSLSYQITISIS